MNAISVNERGKSAGVNLALGSQNGASPVVKIGFWIKPSHGVAYNDTGTLCEMECHPSQ